VTAKAGNGMKMEAIRPFLAACALAYFVIGKVGFEPRLALGSMSVNQALQIAVFVGLCCVPWYRGLGSIGRSRTLALAASLTLLLAIWAIDSANTAYAPSKVQGYAGLVLPSLVVLAGSLRGSQDVRRLLWLLAAVGTTMMLLGLLLLALGAAPPRLAILGGGANVYARMLGTALIVWVGFGYLGSKRWKISVWVLLGFAAALLFAGSKTVILGIGLSFVVLAWQIRSRRLAYGALVGTVLFVTLPLWTHAVVQHVELGAQPDRDGILAHQGAGHRACRLP